jgi:CRP/FNR family transcriptional regulator, anaerobic regulatory protein
MLAGTDYISFTLSQHPYPMEIKEYKAQLPTLTDPELWEEILSKGTLHRFEPGQAILEPGQYIKMVPIVVEGAIKIMRMDEEGHELFLYYLEPGETCAISLTCCSAHKPSEVKAVAEAPTTLIGIPVGDHEQWTHKYRQWKEFVSQTYQNRFQEVLAVIDEIAFKRMDERLLKYILVKVRQFKSNELTITHQEIASELGTSREVVSRLLKQLEKRKLIELGRNKIYVRDNFEELVFPENLK